MDKRKLIAILALSGSIAIGSLFMGGDEPIHGSYRGGYYSQAGSYRGGGAAAPMDTVTIVFAINVDTTSITHSHSEFNYWISQADSAYDLSDAANEFAFCVIDSGNPYSTGYQINSSCAVRLEVHSSSGGSSTRWRMNDPNRVHELVYIPYEKFIPARSQIVSATYKREMLDVGDYFGEIDTFCATLMTIEGDSVWHGSVGTTTPVLGRYAHGSWRVQTAGLNTHGYPASSAGEWSPHWNDRDKYWKIGEYSDWSGVPVGGGDFQNYEEYDQDVTNCVQAAVNGESNNGICTSFMSWPGTSRQEMWMTWEQVGFGEDDFTFVVVKYLTKPYVAPYPGGAENAFVFMAYDGRQPYTSQMVKGARDRGRVFSIFPTGQGVLWSTAEGDSNDPLIADINFDWGSIGDHTTAVTVDSLLVFNAAGFDIANHSVWHRGMTSYVMTGGEVINEYTPGMLPDTLTAAATAYDSLLFDTSPEFLYYCADAADGAIDGIGRNESNLLWGKVFGIPGGTTWLGDPDDWNQYSLKAWDYHGYVGAMTIRGATSSPDNDGYYWHSEEAAWTPSGVESDTSSVSGPPNNRLKARNMLLKMCNIEQVKVFGDSDTFDENTIKELMRNVIYDTRAKGHGAILVTTHAVKPGDPSYEQSGGYEYNYGANPEELGFFYDLVDTLGSIWCPTFGAFCRWEQQWATPCATPAGYSQPDSFKFDAADNVWFVPDGMDNRFIRGLR